MKTLRQIFEELDNDQADILKKIQELNLHSDNLKRQVNELNNMWRKKAINDSEYKKRMEELNKQLADQKQQAEKNKIAQNAANSGVNPPEQTVI